MFLKTKCGSLASVPMLALVFSNSACACCLFVHLHCRSEPGLANKHEPTTYVGLHTGFGFTYTVKMVTYILFWIARGFLY